MKSYAVLSALFAAALAAPSQNAITRSLARRSKSAHHASETLNENWAGAVLNSGAKYTAVSATFDVLTPSVPKDFTTNLSEYTASAWIGIDGAYCDGGLWQAGVDSIVEKNGDTSFYAWYEWYPAATQVIDIGTISAGDSISVSISAASTTQGTVVLENNTTGKKFSKTVTSSDALCLGAVEWIMEDVTFDDDKTGLANFGTCTFTNAAFTSSKTESLSSATIYDIVDDKSETLTSSKVTSNSVVVSYV